MPQDMLEHQREVGELDTRLAVVETKVDQLRKDADADRIGDEMVSKNVAKLFTEVGILKSQNVTQAKLIWILITALVGSYGWLLKMQLFGRP